MNAVEIEEVVSKLAEEPFDAAEYPFAMLEGFGNKSTTVKRLRSGTTNQSDVGRRFKNNTERPEKLFEIYTEMTQRESTAGKVSSGTRKKSNGRKKKGLMHE